MKESPAFCTSWQQRRQPPSGRRPRQNSNVITCNTVALVIRIGFWGPLYYNSNKETVKQCKYLGPHIRDNISNSTSTTTSNTSIASAGTVSSPILREASSDSFPDASNKKWTPRLDC